MSAVTSNGVRYSRVVFCDIDNVSFNLMGKLEQEEYVVETEMGTKELSSYDVVRLEDDVRSQATLTEDELGTYTDITLEELEQFKEDIGTDVYDALLQEEIDFVIFVSE